MSVREKQAWMAVVSTFLFWPYYFITLFTAIGSGNLDGWALLTTFLWTLGIHVAILLGMSIVAARMAHEEFDAPPDELERVIEARADKAGMRVLELAVSATAIASLWISGFAREVFIADPAGATAIMMANGLMIAGMVSGLVREIILIIHFRLTAAA
jgi:hypothetical protein